MNECTLTPFQIYRLQPQLGPHSSSINFFIRRTKPLPPFTLVNDPVLATLQGQCSYKGFRGFPTATVMALSSMYLIGLSATLDKVDQSLFPASPVAFCPGFVSPNLLSQNLCMYFFFWSLGNHGAQTRLTVTSPGFLLFSFSHPGIALKLR